MKRKAIVMFLSFLVHYSYATNPVMLTSEGQNNSQKQVFNEGITNAIKQIVVYWDTSLSMQKNNITKELYLIQQYIAANPSINSVKVITFSNAIGVEKTFYTSDNLSKELYDSLSTLSYGGASNFSLLFKEKMQPDQYVVFTDGISTYGDFLTKPEAPVLFISNTQKINAVGIDLFLNANKGVHRNLNNFTDDFSIAEVLDESASVLDSMRKRDDNSFYGTVSFGNIPLKGCKIRIKEKLVQVESDTKGRFVISAEEGDVLQFTFAGVQTLEKTLGQNRELLIELQQDREILEAISLQTKKLKQEEKKIEVNGRLVERRKSGYTIYELNNKSFFKGALYFRDLVRQGNIPGLRINWQGEVRVRGTSSLKLRNTPLYVIDGVKLLDEPSAFPIDLIKNISVLPSLASTNRYGSLGRAGAIVITTKQGSLFNEEEEKKYSLLVTGNDYDESPVLIGKNANPPSYLSKLMQSSSFEEATSQYYTLRKSNKEKVPFYVYSAEYFKKWDKNFANQVLSNIAEVAHMDFSALRTLAFKLEEQGDKEHALVIYQQIFKLRPYSVQSFLDLTRSYEDNAQYQKAYNLYSVILKNYHKSVNFDIVYDQVESQLKRFLNLYRSHVDYSDLPNHLLSYKGHPVRIVFEWNDPQAEFELQFVNPDKKYYKWTRKMTENPDLKEDLKNGVCSKEFVIEAKEQGDWIINVQSFGKDNSFNPDFLKYAVYRNYGLQNETKEIRFVKLYNQQDKVTLDKLNL